MPGLFDPFVVRNHTLKNRIVMAPMGTRMATPAGEVTDRHIRHYTNRATGNVGLIMVEGGTVRGGLAHQGSIWIWDDSFIPGLRRLASAIREVGASAGIQINHAGPRIMDATVGGQPVSPSGIPIRKEWGLREIPVKPRALREDEMEGIAQSYAEAAARAVEAGFDVVEIHGAHGLLLCHFLSPLTNLRADRYGGGINGRVTFPCEVVAAVRKSIGDDVPLFYRLGASDLLPGGLTAEEGQQAAKALVGAGVDVIDVSGGLCGSRPAFLTEQGYYVPFAEGIRRVANAPVVGVGLIRDPEYADQIVREGRVDLVAIGRGLLEDPLWARKAAEKLGVKVTDG